MFPFIRNTPTYTLNISKLSGGVNLRDGLTLINDNQLTDVKNMWFKDGMLRTRPSINSNKTNKIFEVGEGDVIEVKNFPDVTFHINGKKYQIVTILESRRDGDHSQFFLNIFYNEFNTNNVEYIGEIGFYNEYSYFLVSHNNSIYCCWCASDSASTDITDFWGSCINPDDIYGTEYEKRRSSFHIHKFSYKNDSYGNISWDDENVSGTEIAPLVAINCKYSGDSEGDENTIFENSGVKGTLMHGHNLLCDYVKVKYTTVNKSVGVADGETNIHPMIYKFPTAQEGFDIEYKYCDIIAEITDIYGNVTKHELMLGETGGGHEENINSDGLRMYGNKKGIWFERGVPGSEETNLAYVTKDDIEIENNMTVTYPSMQKETDKVKAFKMTGSTHYGNRIFLFGNTKENESSLILWSDLNDPLYFSENNYAYIGDKSQKVTALGKQNDKLIIFKEHEIYQTQYVQGNEVSASSVINQEVVDLSTTSAYFPLTQVHSTIGCDCPNTVQLCRNRLVWLSSEGKVYTLVSQSQYNERSVLCVSEMINRKLGNENNLKLALSADWLGHYVLSVGNNMYIMDYDSYGYNYISSFTKNDDANIKIPWYYWELPITPAAIICSTGNLFFLSVNNEYYTDDDKYKSAAFCSLFCFEYNSKVLSANDILYIPCLPLILDESKKLVSPKISMVQTKLFNLGSPARLKSVPIVNFSFGYNDGEPIKVEFISERNIPDEHTVTLDGAETNEREPEHIHQCRLFPYTKGTVMFGARLSCEGDMSIASMTLQYKALGGAK